MFRDKNFLSLLERTPQELTQPPVEEYRPVKSSKRSMKNEKELQTSHGRKEKEEYMNTVVDVV